jgi:hypothetical protein
MGAAISYYTLFSLAPLLVQRHAQSQGLNKRLNHPFVSIA